MLGARDLFSARRLQALSADSDRVIIYSRDTDQYEDCDEIHV